MALTRLQMFQFVLDQAQLEASPYYLAKARLWYKIVVDKLTLRQDYKFYNKVIDTPWVSGQKVYNVPSDYQRSDACFQVNEAGVQGDEIFIRDTYQFDPYVSSASGMPTVAYINNTDNTIVFNSAPTNPSGKQFRLRYFKLPTDYSLTDSDDNVVPDFEDCDVIMQHMLSIAFEREDDERQSSKKMDAKLADQAQQRNMYDADSSSSNDLARESFRGRRGYGRRGNGWF